MGGGDKLSAPGGCLTAAMTATSRPVGSSGSRSQRLLFFDRCERLANATNTVPFPSVAAC